MATQPEYELLAHLRDSGDGKDIPATITVSGDTIKIDIDNQPDIFITVNSGRLFMDRVQ